MFRYLLAAFALLASPCVAQIVTSPVRIPDSPRDGKIKLVAFASRVTPAVARNTLVYGPCNDAAPYQYSVAALCPVVAPVPPVVVPPIVTPPVTTTPAPAGDVVGNADGSVYARSGSTIVGINDSGALNSNAPLPAGWPHSHYNSGGERKTAGLQIAGTEYMQANAVFQGAMITQGAIKTRQHNVITGPDVLKGANDGLRWSGSNATVKIDQAVALADGRVSYRVTLTNLGSMPITRYDFWGDFNPGDNNAMMSATATEARQGAISLRSSDPRAIFYVTPVFDLRPATVLPTKTVIQAQKLLDRSIAVAFLLNIAPGSSDRVTFEVGKN